MSIVFQRDRLQQENDTLKRENERLRGLLEEWCQTAEYYSWEGAMKAYSASREALGKKQ